MTRSELIAVLQSHGLKGVEDPPVRIATGHPGGEDFEVRLVPSDRTVGPHILLVPDID